MFFFYPSLAHLLRLVVVVVVGELVKQHTGLSRYHNNPVTDTEARYSRNRQLMALQSIKDT